MKKISILLSILMMFTLFSSTGLAENVNEYKIEYKLFNKKQKTKNTNIQKAYNSLNDYTKEVMMKDLNDNGKTLDDIVTITKSYTYFKRNSKGEITPLNANDIKKIQQKIEKQQKPYEKQLEKSHETKVSESVLSSIFQTSTANAYQQETYDGISVTTWATDYSSGTSYDVRYKIYGVFNWLWDDDSQTYDYNPDIDGDDFMTLNWSGDLTLENDRYAEVQIYEYPWDTDNVVRTYNEGDSSGFIELADVETNGGIGYRFDEKYQLGAPAYQAKADSGHMWVYVHKNTAENEDGNFKFTYTHTWKDSEIGYSIQAGNGTAAGSINIQEVDKTKNFLTYDSFSM
jgi:Fe2+ or Zn2+ uptake regulation protein